MEAMAEASEADFRLTDAIFNRWDLLSSWERTTEGFMAKKYQREVIIPIITIPTVVTN